ncbi:TauD/TfdA family dioxygenase [Streptomyces sp. NBC_00287]|uniref:TauD/TfdA dioxygenase family protein n=1 Tax=Streptomyces sp. NBC_00287 TaxID=2975702 RepID=UPI00325461B5
MVRVHPETGEKALFISPGSTTRITGFTELESRHLLDLLFQHMTSTENTVRFRWEPGSIALLGQPHHLPSRPHRPGTGGHAVAAGRCEGLGHVARLRAAHQRARRGAELLRLPLGRPTGP